ncbi:MAG: Mrp/NBP35 family ATP-binding protein [Candidatus Cloacimonetes bacterium]|nr:Mrp/NBP35 family ATP-binding protein [Candidatus Cloacimonadota bacterium]MBL7108377.1 Mrp/NBP35 family ATP-binding protein [Candidatus Cloacimonadota bacterium]
MNKNDSEKKKEMTEKFLKENINKIKHKLIILSGKGGVGKSTIAVNLAFGLSKIGKKVGVLDVDIHGPSIAKLLGIEGRVITKSKNDRPGPIRVNDNLFAMTIASLLKNPDDPIIWRGPLKMGVIKQFLSDIQWPVLDYLIIDCPPGTGDEPLSAVQIIGKLDGSIIVSTPQDLALLDVRKTINFSVKMNVPILGIIQNMSAFKCPHCGKEIDVFSGSGISKAVKDFGIEVLGKIPIDKKIAESGDAGLGFIHNYENLESSKEMLKIIDKIMEKIR